MTPKVKLFQTSFGLKVPCVGTEVIEPDKLHQPPMRLVVAVPTESGEYPVVVFQHGFCMANGFYTQLFEHIASYGYIVVAPQVVTTEEDATKEIQEVAEVVNWLPGNLSEVVTKAVAPEAVVTPALDKLVLAGHSRGAKVAFALALDLVSKIRLKVSGLVALDPVDGVSEPTNPPIVQEGCDHCRDLQFPVLIEGTGYPLPKCPWWFPGAQAQLVRYRHQAFYDCISSPKLYLFVASEFGHLDFLDDSVDLLSKAICQSGASKRCLRNFTGKLFVAFLEETFHGKGERMNRILQHWQEECIKLEEPQTFTRPPALVALSRL